MKFIGPEYCVWPGEENENSIIVMGLADVTALSAILAVVTFESAIFAVVTEEDCNIVVVIISVSVVSRTFAIVNPCAVVVFSMCVLASR